MLIYSIEANAGVVGDTELADVGVFIPPPGSLFAVDDESLALDLQTSNELRALLTDDAFGAGASTLVLIDPVSGPVNQLEIDQYLDDQETGVQWARISLTGQNNTNTSAVANAILLNGITTTIPGMVVAGNEVRLIPDGAYEVVCQYSLEGAATRANCSWRILANGVTQIEKYGGNYNRNASGHNETGDTISQIVEFSAGVANNILSFESFRTGGAGTINLQSSATNRSWITMKRLRSTT